MALKYICRRKWYSVQLLSRSLTAGKTTSLARWWQHCHHSIVTRQWCHCRHGLITTMAWRQTHSSRQPNLKPRFFLWIRPYLSVSRNFGTVTTLGQRWENALLKIAHLSSVGICIAVLAYGDECSWDFGGATTVRLGHSSLQSARHNHTVTQTHTRKFIRSNDDWLWRHLDLCSVL